MAAQVIHRHLPASSYGILLFGSWARLDATPTSDINSAIVGNDPVDVVVMARIKEEIENLPTLRKIAVVDLEQVDDRFKDRAMSAVRAVRVMEPSGWSRITRCGIE